MPQARSERSGWRAAPPSHMPPVSLVSVVSVVAVVSIVSIVSIVPIVSVVSVVAIVSVVAVVSPLDAVSVLAVVLALDVSPVVLAVWPELSPSSSPSSTTRHAVPIARTGRNKNKTKTK